MERPGKRVVLVRAGRHDLVLRALPHPGCADLRQEMHIEFIRKDHHRMRLQVFMMQPNAGQAFAPVWVVIFGHELGAFPYSAYLMEPASYRFRRHLNAVFRFERGRERGTTPAGAAPAIGTRGGFE